MKKVLKLILYIAGIILASYLIVTFVAQRTVVNGLSMNPTLEDRDQLIVNKIGYRFHEPEQFDIIVFPPHEGEKMLYIKRIVALPGDTVQVADGKLFVNDKEIDEGFDKMQDAGLAADPVTLGEDEYFVLGDNRNDSTDSRFIGPIKRDAIVGKAWVRLFPHPGKLK